MNQTGPSRYILIAAAAIATLSIGYALSRDGTQGAVESGVPTGEPEAAGGELSQAIPELRQRLVDNPDDIEGWALLGLAYAQTGQFTEAAEAYGRAAELDSTNATYFSALGEALVLATPDDFSDAARQAFARALALDPTDPRARYFEGVRLDLAGERSAALDAWIALLRDTPPGAPWEADLRRVIAEVSNLAGIDVSDRVPPPGTPAANQAPSTATQGIPGPSREQMQAASQLPQGQRDMMVENMVEGLDRRLRASPNDADGWIMLIRSRMQLGETAQAADAWRRAREAFSGNSSQLARINASARTLGVPGA